jgi:hypothetical protein
MTIRVFNSIYLRRINKNPKKSFPHFNSLHYVLAPIMLMIWFSFLVPANDWKLEKDSEGVKIYTRDVSGSDFKEIKVEFIVKSTLAGVSKIFNDIPSYTQWVYNCTEAKVIKRISSFEFYTYSVYSLPWPADNRDEISHSVQTQDALSKAITIKINGEKTFIPENEGMVRVESIHGITMITPLKDGDVQIIYQLHMNPGGELPPFLVNLFLIDAPFNSFVNFKKLTSLPENYNYRSEEIIEP